MNYIYVLLAKINHFESKMAVRIFARSTIQTIRALNIVFVSAIIFNNIPHEPINVTIQISALVRLNGTD